MENGKRSSKAKSRNYMRSTKSSLRTSVRKKKGRAKRHPEPEPQPQIEREEVISPDELFDQNKDEVSESLTQSETTLTQQESNNFDEECSELKEIKEEDVQQELQKSSARNNRQTPSNRKNLRKSQSGQKRAINELRKSCYRRSARSPKNGELFQKEMGVDLENSQKENKLYIQSLQTKLNELVEAGEYLKADLVYKEMKQAKARFSEAVVSNIKKEMNEGERMLNETLLDEEKDLQTKFDELRQRILDDFESQISQLEKKFEEDEQSAIDKFNGMEEKQHEKKFKKSVHLLSMEEQIRGLLKNREYRSAEDLKHRITNRMNMEVSAYKEREEEKLDVILKAISVKKETEMKSIEHRLNSALNELKIAFREQKEALKKRQTTLKRNFKNKELLKLNRINVGSENKKTVEKFRSEVLRKEPFKNHRFRKTQLNKENCIDL